MTLPGYAAEPCSAIVQYPLVKSRYVPLGGVNK